MGHFRKKPVVIEAHRIGDPWPDSFWQNVVDNQIVLHLEKLRGEVIGHVEIKTLEGVMRGEWGDWIIRGVKGELYPCKPDIFAATYEPVDAPLEKTSDEMASLASRLREYVNNPDHVDPMSGRFRLAIHQAADALSAFPKEG